MRAEEMTVERASQVAMRHSTREARARGEKPRLSSCAWPSWARRISSLTQASGRDTAASRDGRAFFSMSLCCESSSILVDWRRKRLGKGIYEKLV